MDDLRSHVTSLDPTPAVQIRDMLRYLPPFETTRGPDEFSTSGLDCLTQVIRHIHSQSNWFEDTVQSEDDDDQQDNPLLKYAWQSMERDGADGVASTQQTKEQAAQKQVLLKILVDSGEVFNQSTMVSFWGLDRSPFLERTLWGRDDFRLYSGFQQTEDRPEWHPKPDNNGQKYGASNILYFQYLPVGNRAGGGDTLVSLQGCVDGMLRPRTIDGTREVWLFRQPSIVRVAYTSNHNPPLSFESLRSFELPIADVKNLSDSDDVPIERRVAYVILAVVRHGLRPRDRDYVRTYNVDGTQVQLKHKPPAFVNDSWSISSNRRHTFTLFYIKHPDGVGLDVLYERQKQSIPEPGPDLLGFAEACAFRAHGR